jgi:hypothetical protein
MLAWPLAETIAMGGPMIAQKLADMLRL